jgi:hypothetical protein
MSDESSRNHAIVGACERRIMPRISVRPIGMILGIDLDHESLRGSVEGRDEAPDQRHLATKYHAELPPANARPKRLLGRSKRHTHAASAFRKHAARWTEGLLVRVMPLLAQAP